LCYKLKSIGEPCDTTENACDSSWCSTYKHTCVKHCNIPEGFTCDTGETCAEINYCDSTGSCSTAPNLDYHYLEYKPGDEGTCLELNGTGSDCDDETLGCHDSICSYGVCRDTCVFDTDCTNGICYNYNFYCRDVSWADCDWSNPIMNPDPDRYRLTGGWYNTISVVPGVCYDVVPDGSPCEVGGDQCYVNSYCYDGLCRLNCKLWSIASCSDTESCVFSIGYCDANYSDCDTNGPYTAGTYETLYYDIDNEIGGLCYDNASGGTSCDDTNVCASGHCDKNGVCQTACTDNSECAASEACFSVVTYCDAEFKNCVPEESSELTHIHFNSDGSPGYCYNNGDIGDACSINEGCKSGFCNGSVCIQFARKCLTASDCEEG